MISNNHLRRFLRAGSISVYWNLNPCDCVLVGSTFCPSRTTEAPSPRIVVSAKSGTGSHEGLPIREPSVEQNSLILQSVHKSSA